MFLNLNPVIFLVYKIWTLHNILKTQVHFKIQDPKVDREKSELKVYLKIELIKNVKLTMEVSDFNNKRIALQLTPGLKT